MSIRTLQQVKAKLNNKAPVTCEFQVNEKVMFTNDYGITFGPYRIIGFDHEANEADRFIYLDSESYWFPVRPSSLTKA